MLPVQPPVGVEKIIKHYECDCNCDDEDHPGLHRWLYRGSLRGQEQRQGIRLGRLY